MTNTKIDDGGPAFPGTSLDTEVRAALLKSPANYSATDATRIASCHGGMSLRDWFAGQALASMTVAPDYSKGPCNAEMARRAYCIADAMLAARKEKV